MMHCGLLGQKLSHSYSPAIHSMLGDYEYKLYETEPENVETFLRKGDFDALNVTIPYKKCAAAICDELSETARHRQRQYDRPPRRRNALRRQYGRLRL